uniref:RNA polymerase-associated protein CTR9 homolog n=1 Tax=Rhizophora mucronata TaxID=61149 RepID=A0A2P2LK52_RHIMU
MDSLAMYKVGSFYCAECNLGLLSFPICFICNVLVGVIIPVDIIFLLWFSLLAFALS